MLSAANNLTARDDGGSRPDAVSRWLSAGAAVTLCAALLAPFGALPAFDTGYFNLVSASILWLHVCAGTGAILLAAGIVVAPDTVLSSAMNPASVALAFFAALSAIPVAYSDFPMLIVLGGPQSGKGVLWFFDTAVFVALGWLIKDCRRTVAIVLGMAIAVVGTVAALLAYIRLSDAELLLRGGDSYAYLGLALPFLTGLITEARMRRRYFVATGIVSVFCIITADNKAAVITALLLFTFFGTARRIPSLTAWLARLRFPVIYAPVLIVALALSFAVVSIDFRGSFDSIDSRLLIAKIVRGALSDASVTEWLFGHGWGHTQSGFYRHLTESGASLLDNRWDFLWRDIFHSHNLVLELVYEAGLAGLAAFAALLAALVAFADGPRRLAALTFVGGYLLMNSVWFEFAHTLPILSLAIAALTVRRERKQQKQAARVAVTIAYVMLAVGCFAASVSLYEFAREVKPYKPSRGALERAAYPTGSFPRDPRGNDFIRASVYRDALRSVNKDSRAGAVTSKRVIEFILDDIESRISVTRSPELLLVGLVIFNEGHYLENRAWIRPVIEGRKVLWNRLASRHLEFAPKRTDVLVPHLSWLFANGENDRLRKIVARIRRSNTNEPVGLYFQGVIETRDPSPAAKRRGLRRIAQAVENGAERYIEVPNWLKKAAAEAKAKAKAK